MTEPRSSTGPLPTYLVLNRFDDEFGEYHRFVDQRTCRLAYLTIEEGVGVLDRANAYDLVVVPDLSVETVLPPATTIARRCGGFAGIVGLSEYDLLTAATLRERLGVPGNPTDVVLPFKDKVLMKRRVAEAGIRVPAYHTFDPAVSIMDTADQVRLPAVLKPRTGAASTGVVRVDDRATLLRVLAEVDRPHYEWEEYIEGAILHVDGVRRGGGFHFVSVSEYLNSCLDFAGGKPLGSVLLDGSPRRDAMVRFAGQCLDALRLADGPFHLELFETPGGELVFLEVGLRPGGGEIPFVHRDLFRIDLLGEAFRVTLNMPPLSSRDDLPTVPCGGGFVMVPEPGPFPSRVTRRTSLLGTVPGLYREIIPEVGELFDGHGGYGHIGGRFHLRGPDEATVRATVAQVMERYEVAAAPVRQAPALGGDR